MAEVKRYTATFLGESFPFISDEQEEHVRGSIALVERLLREAIQQAPQLDHKRAYSLVLLQLAQRIIQHDGELHQLRERVEHTVGYARRLAEELPDL